MTRIFGLTVMLFAATACDDDGSGAGSDADTGAGGPATGVGSQSGTDASGTGAPGEINVAAIEAAAAEYAQSVQINNEARSSRHAFGDTVNMFVDASAAAMYATVDPDAPGAEVTFAEGTTIYKEHLTAGGEFNGLTIMFKGPVGYNPDAGDWWWGRMNSSLELLDEGKVGFCISCHTPVSVSDFVFGVPGDNRL